MKGGKKQNGARKMNKRQSKSRVFTQGTGNPQTATRLTQVGSYEIVGAPDKMRISLKYTDSYVFTGSANPSPQVWRLNSLFDPDLTSVGHQPTYYDQWSAIYNQYLVTGAHVHFDIASDASVPVLAAFAASDVNQSSLGIDAMSEMKWSKRKILGPLTGSGVSSMDIKLSTPAIIGESVQQQLGDPSAYSAVTTNPTDVVFGWFRVAAFDSSTAITVSVLATITFNCELRSLSAPGTS